ncbi:MAG: radical SAM protein [Candidatus Caldatribacteriota bacterium]|nr:radical SAM protein [Candidatus Caldatribacteriota bacterium]
MSIKYIILSRVFGKELPFIGGIVINDSCNLNCSHCSVANRDIPDLTFEEVEIGLRRLYAMGMRYLYIEGGEPFLWRDNGKSLKDVIHLAREIGFRFIVIYTNGTFPIIADANTVFVSLDGLKDTHNKIRGNTYDRIISNIIKSPHKKLLINYTINKKNEKEIEQFCDEISKIEKIKGIFFYFYTPSQGIDDLYLGLDERKIIIKRILKLKKIGYRILNSKAALMGVYNDSWERPNKLSYLYANKKIYRCCRSIGNSEICKDCGYLGLTEIYYIAKFNPDAIYTAFKYL